MKAYLYAPVDYVNLDPVKRSKIVNGCGSAQARFDFVPDHIWGLRVTDACNIHDYMYSAGRSIEDKEIADRVFLNNLIRLINAKGGALKPLRRIRAKAYYNAVKYFGGSAFWDGKKSEKTKNPSGNLMEVIVG
ncbi:MAG: phospholipase [Proteobacteria bacterium]|nr:phospholipase [Pseudomonadota bacterium]